MTTAKKTATARPTKPAKTAAAPGKAAYLAATRRRDIANIISSCASLVKNYAYDGGAFYDHIVATMRAAIDELESVRDDADAANAAAAASDAEGGAE